MVVPTVIIQGVGTFGGAQDVIDNVLYAWSGGFVSDTFFYYGWYPKDPLGTYPVGTAWTCVTLIVFVVFGWQGTTTWGRSQLATYIPRNRAADALRRQLKKELKDRHKVLKSEEKARRQLRKEKGKVGMGGQASYYDVNCKTGEEKDIMRQLKEDIAQVSDEKADVYRHWELLLGTVDFAAMDERQGRLFQASIFSDRVSNTLIVTEEEEVDELPSGSSVVEWFFTLIIVGFATAVVAVLSVRWSPSSIPETLQDEVDNVQYWFMLPCGIVVAQYIFRGLVVRLGNTSGGDGSTRDGKGLEATKVLRGIVFSTCTLCALYIGTRASDDSGCFENVIGMVMMRMLILDTIINILLRAVRWMVSSFKHFLHLVGEKERGVQRESISYGRLKLQFSSRIMAYFFQQTVVFLGLPFAPVLPALAFLSMVIQFIFTRAASLNEQPSFVSPTYIEKRIMAYMVSLIVVSLIVYSGAWAASANPTCGPHEGVEPLVALQASVAGAGTFFNWLVFSPFIYLAALTVLSGNVFVRLKGLRHAEHGLGSVEGHVLQERARYGRLRRHRQKQFFKFARHLEGVESGGSEQLGDGRRSASHTPRAGDETVRSPLSTRPNKLSSRNTEQDERIDARVERWEAELERLIVAYRCGFLYDDGKRKGGRKKKKKKNKKKKTGYQLSKDDVEAIRNTAPRANETAYPVGSSSAPGTRDQATTSGRTGATSAAADAGSGPSASHAPPQRGGDTAV